MYRSKTKIWTGLGAFVLTTSGGHAAAVTTPLTEKQQPAHQMELKPHYLKTFADSNPHSLMLASNIGQGGEGGEAGAMAGVNPDEAYMTKLKLMQGHLRIGHALVAARHWDDAIMHFMHPIEEIYGSLESDLSDRNVEPFRNELHTLAQRVRSHEGGESFNEAFRSVQTRLDDAEKALDPDVRHDAVFRLNVAMRLLQQAALEYNAAITDGRIVNVAEYQDSRGFVWTAEELLNSVGSELEQRNAEAWQSIRTLLNGVKAAWPTVEPPNQPAQSVSQVLSNISRIDLAASQLR